MAFTFKLFWPQAKNSLRKPLKHSFASNYYYSYTKNQGTTLAFLHIFILFLTPGNYSGNSTTLILLSTPGNYSGI